MFPYKLERKRLIHCTNLFVSVNRLTLILVIFIFALSKCWLVGTYCPLLGKRGNPAKELSRSLQSCGLVSVVYSVVHSVAVICRSRISLVKVII